MSSTKISKYAPLSIFSGESRKHNGKSPFSCLDADGNNTLLDMKMLPTSPITKKVGRPPKLYHLCKYCTGVFFSKSARIQHAKSCTKALAALKTSPMEPVVQPEEKLEVEDPVEEKVEIDGTEEMDDHGDDEAAMCPGQRSLAKINVYENLELKDQIDVGKLLNFKAIVHSPDFVFKRKSSEDVKSEDEIELLAGASTSDTTPVVFDQNIKQIEDTKPAALQGNIRCMCKPCSSTTFETELELMRHVRTQHSYPKTKMALSEVQKFYDVEDRSICPICSKPLLAKFRSAFINHLHTHLAQKMYACKVCDTKFRREDYLSKHTKRHIMTKESVAALLAKSCDSEASMMIDESEGEAGEQVNASSSKETKVAQGTVIHRICYGPPQDGSKQWVVKWQKTEYVDSSTDMKSSVATQTLTESPEKSIFDTPDVDFDHSTRNDFKSESNAAMQMFDQKVESVEESVDGTPDSNGSRKRDDALMTTPVVDSPDLKSTSFASKAPDQKVESLKESVDGTPDSGSARNASRKPDDALVTTPVVDPPDLKPTNLLRSNDEQHDSRTETVVQKIRNRIRRKNKSQNPTGTRTIQITSKFDFVQRSNFTPLTCRENKWRRSYKPLLSSEPEMNRGHDTKRLASKSRHNSFVKENSASPVTDREKDQNQRREVKPRHNHFFQEDDVTHFRKRQTSEDRVDHLKIARSRLDSFFRKDNVTPVTQSRRDQDAGRFRKRQASEDHVDHRRMARSSHERTSSFFRKGNVTPVNVRSMDQDADCFRKRHISEERVDHENAKRRHDFSIRKEIVSLVTEPRKSQETGRFRKRNASEERIDHHENAKRRQSPVTEPGKSQKTDRFRNRHASEEHVDHHENAKRRHDSPKKENESPVTEPRKDQETGRYRKRHVSEERLDHHENAKRRHDSPKKENESPVTEPRKSQETGRFRKRHVSEERVDHHENAKRRHDSPKKENESPVTEPRKSQETGRFRKRHVSEERVDHHENAKRRHDSPKKENESPVTEPRKSQETGSFRKRHASEERVDHYENAKRRQDSEERVVHHENAKRRHDSPKKENESPVTESRKSQDTGRFKKRHVSEERVDHHENAKRRHDFHKKDNESPVTEPRKSQETGRFRKRHIQEERVDHHENAKRRHDSPKKENESPVTELRKSQEIGRFRKRHVPEERLDYHENAKRRHDSPKKENESPVTEFRKSQDTGCFKKRHVSEERVDHHENAKRRHDSPKKENESPVTEPRKSQETGLFRKRHIQEGRLDHHENAKRRHDSPKKENESPVTESKKSQETGRSRKRHVSEERLDHHENAKRRHDSLENESPVTEPRKSQETGRFKKRHASEERVDHHENAKGRHDSPKKENVSPVTETEMDREVRLFLELINSEDDVDQRKRDKARKKRSFDQLQCDQTEASPPTQKKPAFKKENKNRTEMVPMVMLDPTIIVDNSDEAFERSAEGLIKQLKQASLKRSKKNSSDNCAKVRKTESVNVAPTLAKKRSRDPPVKEENLSPATETEMEREIRLLEELLDSEVDVDQHKPEKTKKKKKKKKQRSETEESPLCTPVKKENKNKSRHGMVPVVEIESSIIDHSDQAFERSAEGLIQQLKQGSPKKSKKKKKKCSAGSNSSDGCPRDVMIRLPVKLLQKIDSIQSVQNFRVLRSGGKNYETSLYV